MTEDQWLRYTDPIPMLESLREGGAAFERRLRLFAAACCRRAWHLLDADGRAVIEMSERFADGSTTEAKLMAAVWASRGCLDIDARAAADDAAVGAWRPAVALLAAACGPDDADIDAERAAQAGLLRDIFGTIPFGPVPPPSPCLLAWNDGLIPRLADAAYVERQFPGGTLDPARLAVLTDALEEAGCDDGHLLAHLRGPGPHVRGCFAVDHLLGKG